MTSPSMPTAVQNTSGFMRLIEQAPVAMTILMGPSFVVYAANKKQLQLWQKEKAEVLEHSFFDIFPEACRQDIGQRLPQVYATGMADHATEVETIFERNGLMQTAWYDVSYEPLQNDMLEVEGVMIVSTDVTDKVLARRKSTEVEAVLRQRQDQMELAIAAGHIGTWHWDVQTDVLYWSREQEALYGLPEGTFSGKLDEFLQFIFPEDKARVLSEVAVSNEEHTELNVVFRIIRKDGQLRWINSRSRNYYNSEGKLVYVTGTNRDITEEKAAEEELRLSIQRTQLAQEAAKATLYEVLLEERHTIRQDSLKQVLGYNLEEVLPNGEAWLSLIHPEDKARANTIFEDGIRSGEGFSVEYRVRHKEGHYVWLHDRAIVVRNEKGKPERLVGMSIDITQQKLAEADLVQQKAFTETIIKASPSLTYVFDMVTGSNIFLSPQGPELLGHSEEEIRQMGSSLLERLLHPDDLEPTSKRFALLQDDQEGRVFEIEYRMKHKTGQWVWVHDRARVFRRSEEGHPKQIVGVATNITQRKKDETARQLSEAKYRSLFENAPVSIWEEDFTAVRNRVMELKAQGVTDIKRYFEAMPEELMQLIASVDIVDINEASLHLFGAESKQEILNGLQQIFVHDTMPAFIRELEIIAAGGGRFEEESVVKAFDGRMVHVLVRIDFPTTDDYHSVKVILIDITERKRAEEALRISELRLRLTLDGVGIGAWTWDLRSSVTHFDAKITSLFGLPSDFDGSLEALVNVIVPEDRDIVQKALSQAIEQGVPYKAEFRVKLPDGNIRWLAGHGQLDYTAEGKPALMRGINYDITARKQLEKRMKEQYDELENIYSNAPIGLAIIDKEFRFQRINERLAEINGVPAAQHVGKAIGEIVPDLAEQAEVLFKQIFATGEPLLNVEVKGETKAQPGVERIWNESWHPVKNDSGETFAISVVVEEITEKQRAEEALKESEARFRTMSEHSPMWVWMTTADADVRYANQEMLSYLGLKNYSDFPGRTWEELTHPEDVAFIKQSFFAAAGKQEPFAFECRMKNAATNQFEWCLFKGVPHYDKGVFAGFIGTGISIHLQKQLTENLESLVASRTIELQRSNEDLQRFAHVSSHDLKEPVRKVLTFVSRLNDEFGSALPDKAKKYIDKIDIAARRSSAMIDGVLHYSLLSSYEQQREPVDLHQILEAIIEDLEVAIQQKKAKIHAVRLPVYNGYAQLLHQLLYNLLTNALKFSRPGVPTEIVIGAEHKEGVVSDDERVHGKSCLQLTIQDNGIGFPQEEAERIFQVFSRLHSKDVYEGSGMGLALCKKIVERHEGKIMAESEEGKGTRFTVMLPI
jgi:PAS domain S-box-containing protein